MARKKITAAELSEILTPKPKPSPPPPPATEPLPDPGPPCPTCKRHEGRRIVKVMGDMQFLVVTYYCLDCSGVRWERRVLRTDVCEHGLWKRVPCEPCGRTWEAIETAWKSQHQIKTEAKA